MPIQRLAKKQILPRATKVRNSLRQIAKYVPSRLPPLVAPQHGTQEHRLFTDPKTALTCWPNKQMQWWYFTGQLKNKHGHSFGYELVFFDRKTHADYIGFIPSKLIKKQLLASHFAITDGSKKKFIYWFKGGLLDASDGVVSSDSFFVQIGNWSARQTSDGHIRLHAHEGSSSLSLDLAPEKPLIYHQYDGFSPRGPNPEHASFYCSYTRLKTTGHLRVNGELFEVEGESWMDHEKMTMNPEALIQGWDWYSLQFEDGHDLMLYLLHDKEGDIDVKWSFATLVKPNGECETIRGHEIELIKLRHWISPLSQAKYPNETWITIKSHDISIHITPLNTNCELDTTKNCFVTYWEGPVCASGQIDGRRQVGKGFLELVGYDRRPLTKLIQFLVVPE